MGLTTKTIKRRCKLFVFPNLIDDASSMVLQIDRIMFSHLRHSSDVEKIYTRDFSQRPV